MSSSSYKSSKSTHSKFTKKKMFGGGDFSSPTSKSSKSKNSTRTDTASSSSSSSSSSSTTTTSSAGGRGGGRRILTPGTVVASNVEGRKVTLKTFDTINWKKPESCKFGGILNCTSTKCMTVIQRIKKGTCSKCNNTALLKDASVGMNVPKSKKPHHVGCEKSIFQAGMTHGKMNQLRNDAQEKKYRLQKDSISRAEIRCRPSIPNSSIAKMWQRLRKNVPLTPPATPPSMSVPSSSSTTSISSTTSTSTTTTTTTSSSSTSTKKPTRTLFVLPEDVELQIRTFILQQPKINRQKKTGDLGSIRGSDKYIGTGSYSIPTLNYEKNINMSSNVLPKPGEHFCRGLKVEAFRWEVIGCNDPEIVSCLNCPDCGLSLVYDKEHYTDYGYGRYSTSNGTFKLLFNLTSRPSIVIPYIYAPCPRCQRTTSSFDSDLLAQLPCRLVRLLPFDPTWHIKGSSFIFDKSISQSTDYNIIRYQGVSCIMRGIELANAHSWNDCMIDYLEHIKAWKKVDPVNRMDTKFPPFPSLNDWLLRPAGVPGPESLFNAWETSFNTPGSAGNLSKKEYYDREMQNTSSGQDVSSDHTFKSAKNFKSQKGMPTIKCQYEVVNGYGVVNSAIVTTGSGRGELLHMMEDINHRPHFTPKYWCFDTYPNEKQWLSATCCLSKGYLGIFHLINRIGDLMRKAHKDYNKAMAALRHCVWDYNKSHIEDVKRNLRSGKLNGTKHTEDRIQDLIDSGQFHKRYKMYYHATPKPAHEIKSLVKEWSDMWLGIRDPNLNNRTLGYQSAVDGIKQQLLHTEDISPGGDHTLPSRPKPNQKHDLIQRRSSLGEKVEGFHSICPHFSNIGTRGTRAHAQSMVGTDMYNKDRKETYDFNSFNSEVDQPLHYRQWDMITANNLASECNMAKPFPNRAPQTANNGEKFYYDYYLDQRKREKKHDYNAPGLVNCPCSSCSDRRKRCRCINCSRYRKDEIGAPLSPGGSASYLRSYATLPNIHPIVAEKLNDLANTIAQGYAPTAFANAAIIGIDLVKIFANQSNSVSTMQDLPATSLLPVTSFLPSFSSSSSSSSSSLMPSHLYPAYQNIASKPKLRVQKVTPPRQEVPVLATTSSPGFLSRIGNSIGSLFSIGSSSSSSSSSSTNIGMKRKGLTIPPAPVFKQQKLTSAQKNQFRTPPVKKQKKCQRKGERPIDCKCTCGADSQRVASKIRIRVTHAAYCPVKKWMVEKKRLKKLEGVK
jgi:hypothetical protein